MQSKGMVDCPGSSSGSGDPIFILQPSDSLYARFGRPSGHRDERDPWSK